MSDDCARCGGTRLRISGWTGPTPDNPMPEPCPTCSADVTPRERQALGTAWLIDNQDRPEVKEILSRLATFNATRYRLVVHAPYARTAADIPWGSLAKADLVVCAGNMVAKDRYGASGYVLSDSELRRLRDDCTTFEVVR